MSTSPEIVNPLHPSVVDRLDPTFKDIYNPLPRFDFFFISEGFYLDWHVLGITFVPEAASITLDALLCVQKQGYPQIYDYSKIFQISTKTIGIMVTVVECGCRHQSYIDSGEEERKESLADCTVIFFYDWVIWSMNVIETRRL